MNRVDQKLRRQDPDAWQVVNPVNVDYSSLLGIPVTNVPLYGNSTFIVTSRQFSINCSNVSQVLGYNTSL